MKDERLLNLLKSCFEDDIPYSEHQLRSRRVDEYLGFTVDLLEIAAIEEAYRLFPDGNKKSWGHSLHNAQTWIGLSPDQLQTTYYELYHIVETFTYGSKKNDFISKTDNLRFCDLGAGYGRMGVLIGELYPNFNFLGVEIVDFRVREGKRIFAQQGYINSDLICSNVAKDTFLLPYSDIYFIYDFGDIVQMKRVLNSLSKIADNKEIVLVARGRGINSMVRNYYPWLCIKQPRITETYTIYFS